MKQQVIPEFKDTYCKGYTRYALVKGKREKQTRKNTYLWHLHNDHSNAQNGDQDTSTPALKNTWDAPTTFVAAWSIIVLAECSDISGAALISDFRESCPMTERTYLNGKQVRIEAFSFQVAQGLLVIFFHRLPDSGICNALHRVVGDGKFQKC